MSKWIVKAEAANGTMRVMRAFDTQDEADRYAAKFTDMGIATKVEQA